MGKVSGTKPLIVCFPFVGDLIGGSHISARDLIRGIDRSRFDPLVLVQTKDGAIAKFFEAVGVTVEVAPASADLEHGARIGGARALSLTTRAIALAYYLRRRGVSIVHSNDGRTHATWALAARLAGAKLLWHHRGAPDAAGLRYAAPLLANRVVAVSRFATPPAGRLSVAAKTDVVHSPFDTSASYDRTEARATILADIGRGAGSALVGFSGVFIDRKRPLLFVRAIAALRASAPELDAQGLMFGESLDGMDAQIATLAEELGVSDAIHLMGFRTPGAFWLAGCDLLMVPAVQEPFGRTLIESMLVGTPVVATASGGNVEAIRDGETGRLVPAEDAQALADGCASLLRNRAASDAIAKRAQREARVRFGQAVHVNAIMAIYDQMTGQRRAA